MSALETFERLPRRLVLTGSVCLLLVIAWIDYVTGWEWNLTLFYAIPLACFASRTKPIWGFVFAFACVVAWVLANIADTPHKSLWGFAWSALTRCFYFAVLVIAVDAAKVRRELDRERIRALERSEELKLELLQASEKEQRRIGQDLHDGLAPQLAGVNYAATFLGNELRAQGSPQVADVERICGMLSDAILLTRNLARGIFPVQMDGFGLSIALEDLARTTSTLTRIPVSFSETAEINIPNPEAAMHLYRIAQEAVSNAVEHGQARNIRIVLSKEGDGLNLTVADDGKGMSQARDGTRGIGLHSMEYRSHAMGAELKIESGPNQGTVISCILPQCPPPPNELAA
jgi:signal transduction histidine kinase